MAMILREMLTVGNSRHGINTAVGLEDFHLFWAVKVVSSRACNKAFLWL